MSDLKRGDEVWVRKSGVVVHAPAPPDWPHVQFRDESGEGTGVAFPASLLTPAPPEPEGEVVTAEEVFPAATGPMLHRQFVVQILEGCTIRRKPAPKKSRAEEPKTDLARALRVIRDRLVERDGFCATIADFDAALAELERKDGDDE